MVTAMIFFLAGSLIVLGGVATPTLQEVRHTRQLVESKNSYALAEGLTEDAVYRIKHGITISATETLTEGNTSVSTVISDISGGKRVRSVGSTNNLIRNIEVDLVEGDGVAFNYGVQVGVGGIILENSATINGSVYSSGSVVSSKDNEINGTVISSGPTGLIDGVSVLGDAYAHTIRNAVISGGAYYDTIFQSSTATSLYPGATDQVPLDLPITDDLIDEWKADAATNVISSPCPYIINQTTIIGPVKITCDVIIKKNIDVTLEGAIWVVGDLEIRGGPTIKVGSIIGDKSVPIVVDNPADRLTSSTVKINNTALFEGAPFSTNSHVLIVSQNNSAENNGRVKAIKVGNNIGGNLLLYAGHGEILIANNADLQEVSGYQIRIKNIAEVTYKSGLADIVFTAGPSGGYTINSWLEVE